MSRKMVSRWLLFVMVCALLVPISTGHAQPAAIPITIGVPQGLSVQFKDNLLPKFQQAFPNVRLSMVETSYIAPLDPKSPDAVNKYYEALNTNASAADVLFVTPDEIGIEATRAEYLLDLKPLVSADATFDTSDYSASVWAAYQWDSGVWALPAVYDNSFWVYDPTVFDAANLTYPTVTWTLDDLAKAARSLTVFESDNTTVKVPGMWVDDRVLPGLLMALAGEPFTDPTAAIASPKLTSDKLAVVVQAWAKLEQAGVVTTHPTSDTFQKIPLQLGSTFALREPGSNGAVSGGDTRHLHGALLPSSLAELDAYGFAVSAGTAQPSIAYEITKALTAQTDLGAMLGGVRLARKSIAASAQSAQASGFSAENQAFLKIADMSAVPPPLFGKYVRGALDAAKSGQDAELALRNAETQAAQLLSDAATRRAKLVLVVTEPTDNSVATGKQTLKFGITTGQTSLSHAYEWHQAINDFIATDPQIGKVMLDFVPPVTADWGQKVVAFTDTEDCFYPGGENPTQFKDKLLSLDPYLDADPTFTRDDVIGRALQSVQRANHTYGLPLTLKPFVLKYDVQQFTQAGLPLPTNNWKIDQFMNALKTLKITFPNSVPFNPWASADGGYLFLLIAAYGQLPIDERTTPSTIDYTSHDTVDAIRQVLDLAKNGYIDYLPTNAFIFTLKSPINPKPGSSSALFVSNFTFDPPEDTSGYKPVSFPVGSKYMPVSYTLDAAYISAKTPLAEACYRCIKLLSTRPEVFGGFPARRSVIDSARTEATAGKDAVLLYRAFADQASAPNAVVISEDSIGIVRHWLLRAFDNYVLRNADLDSELRNAEQYTKAYLTCIAGPDAEPTPTNPTVIFLDDKCANKIDPTFSASLFPPQK